MIVEAELFLVTLVPTLHLDPRHLEKVAKGSGIVFSVEIAQDALRMMTVASVATVRIRQNSGDKIVCGRNAFTDAVKWTPIGGLMEVALVNHLPSQPNQIQYRPTLKSTVVWILLALQLSSTRP